MILWCMPVLALNLSTDAHLVDAFRISITFGLAIIPAKSGKHARLPIVGQSLVKIESKPVFDGSVSFSCGHVRSGVLLRNLYQPLD